MAPLAALLLSFLPICAHSQEKPKTPPEPPIPAKKWLTGPDHSDFPAEFKCLPPRLTFQQLHLVECRVSISGEVARGRELHIWLKVANNSGEWIPGAAHTGGMASPNLTKRNEFQFVGGFYANPGQYTAAIIIFDPKSHQYDVHHMPITVKPIENDPLAERVESTSPAVEFLEDSPPGTESFTKISDVNRDAPDSLWPFAHRLDTFPLKSTRPIQLDVVLNLSDIGEAFEIPQIIPRMRRSMTIDPRMLPSPPSPSNVQKHQKEYIGALLAVAQVLASVHPSNGCVRISTIDMLNMDNPIRRAKPESLDWESIRSNRTSAKLAEVSVNALKNRKEQPTFIRDFLTSLQLPIENCGSGSDPMHAVILVSHSYVFPSGSHKHSFKFPDSPSLRYYDYLLRVGSEHVYDDLGSYLKSAGAKSHDVYTPRDLRETLAHTLNDITRPSK